MEVCFDGRLVKDLFSELNASNLSYILMRNISQELPYQLNHGKDIDLLVKYEELKRFTRILNDIGYKEVPHPHRGSVFLYGMKKFRFFRNKEGVLIDLNFKWCCRSLDAGQWIPLDEYLQISAWRNRVLADINGLKYWSFGVEDEFVSLIVRSVFDKKGFTRGYIERIIELRDVVSHIMVKERLCLIFFNYTESLMSQVTAGNFDNIIENYMRFRSY